MPLPLPVIQPARSHEDEARVIELSFKGNRRDYFTTRDETLRPGEYVIVAMERGHDLGRVRSVGGAAARKCSSCGTASENEAEHVPSSGELRRAQPAEVQQLLVLRADEERVRRKAREMVEQHGLNMKVTETEWQWDRNKLILYFTADRRVDFRQLVRDMARTFRTRIELKQIGVRDEAALLGGVGRCGRELCCSTWLREIKPISLQLAKDQNLSLNPAQISGTCGRLMCCLTYEHDSYLQARKRFPREGRTVRTSLGIEKVIGIDIWRDQVTLLDEARQRRVVALADLKQETAAAVRADTLDTVRETGPSAAESPSTSESGTATAAASRRRKRKRKPRASETPPRDDKTSDPA